jgi:hypothetical protein
MLHVKHTPPLDCTPLGVNPVSYDNPEYLFARDVWYPSKSKKRCAFVPLFKGDGNVHSPNQAKRHHWASRRRMPIAGRGLLSGMLSDMFMSAPYQQKQAHARSNVLM